MIGGCVLVGPSDFAVPFFLFPYFFFLLQGSEMSYKGTYCYTNMRRMFFPCMVIRVFRDHYFCTKRKCRSRVFRSFLRCWP